MKSNVRLPRGPFSRVFDPLAVTEWAWLIKDQLTASGITLATADNFAEFEAACGQIAGKEDISGPFDGAYFDIMPRDGLWIIGRQDGQVMHIQALRRDSLEGITLATYWTKQLARIHDGIPGERHAPGAFDITGSVVYHGDLWLDPAARGKGVAPLCCKLAHGLAMIKWAPDYIYSFMSDKLIRSGFHVRKGFAKSHPGAIDWIKPPADIDPADWLIWNSMEDLLHQVRLETDRGTYSG